MKKILTLNNISPVGLDRLPRDAYEISSEFQNPDAILVRSFKMHDMEVPSNLLAVGRAGAGVNNIPIDKMTQLGIPVFNAPGANANAVKELVIAGMLLAARNICAAWDYVQKLQEEGDALDKAVEKGKSQFAGSELPGRTLGVIGLGAIGVHVANAAKALGMNVIGYDPHITVHAAWKLSAQVKQAMSIEEVVSTSDFISFHIPLNDATRNMLSAERIRLLKPNAIILNMARGGVIDEEALLKALDEGEAAAYVTDFPNRQLINHPKVISLPHLGASTAEAEDNCAIMVAEQVQDYIENGNILNSVNFPEMIVPRTGESRLCVVNLNVPNMVGQISAIIAEAGLNIVDMTNKSRGEIAYTLVDLSSKIDGDTVSKIGEIEGVLKVRAI
jgi:D-3-phosphoglycerate dehydrogenase